MYPLVIVKYVVMPNHIQIMVVVEDPQNVPKFVEYLKRESAYVVNGLLGRRKHTVWCDGYDSPVILDPETAIEKLTYITLNPLTASLIERVYKYPLSSEYWINSSTSSSEIQVRRIPRTKIPKLPRRDLTLKDINKAISKLGYRGTETFTLKVEPNAWIDCFEEATTRNTNEIVELLGSNIAHETVQILKGKEGQFPPLESLQTQNIRKEYHFSFIVEHGSYFQFQQ